MIYCKECPACAEQKKHRFLAPYYPAIQPHPLVKLAAVHCTNCGKYYVPNKKVNWTRILAFFGLFLLYVFTLAVFLLFPAFAVFTGGFVFIVIRFIFLAFALSLDFAVTVRVKWTEATELDAKIKENSGIYTWFPIVFAVAVVFYLPRIILVISTLFE